MLQNFGSKPTASGKHRNPHRPGMESVKKVVVQAAWPAILLTGQLAANPGEGLEKLKPFLEKTLHPVPRPEKQKNDIRVDTLGTDLSDHVTLETWQAILDQLNLGEMPPEDEPQPDKAASAHAIAFITPKLQAAYANLKAQAPRQSSAGSTAVNSATPCATSSTCKARPTNLEA